METAALLLGGVHDAIEKMEVFCLYPGGEFTRIDFALGRADGAGCYTSVLSLPPLSGSNPPDSKRDPPTR